MDEKPTVTFSLPSAKAVGTALRNVVNALVVALVILGVILFNRVNNESNVAREAANKAVASAVAANAKAAQGTSVSLCRTLNDLAALTPPPGDAVANPSRAYEQQQHVILSQLSVDLKCPPEG